MKKHLQLPETPKTQIQKLSLITQRRVVGACCERHQARSAEPQQVPATRRASKQAAQTPTPRQITKKHPNPIRKTTKNRNTSMASKPTKKAIPKAPPQDWRQSHLGRLLGAAMRKFDERVLYLMAHNVDVPLALSNLAARAQVSAAHIHITRHVGLEGSRLNDLAEKIGRAHV